MELPKDGRFDSLATVRDVDFPIVTRQDKRGKSLESASSPLTSVERPQVHLIKSKSNVAELAFGLALSIIIPVDFSSSDEPTKIRIVPERHPI